MPVATQGVERSDARGEGTTTEIANGQENLLTMPGVNTLGFHEAIQASKGQLIFCTIPYASIELGILSSANGIKDITKKITPASDWREGEVPVSKGIYYPMVAIDLGRRAERQEGGTPIDNGKLSLYLPAGDTMSHLTHGRGLKLVLDGNLSVIRRDIEKDDFVLAVGDAAVVTVAGVLAEKEIANRADYIGLQESHGLLVLSTIKQWGIDWRSTERNNRQLDKLMQNLEKDTVDFGVSSVILNKLGLGSVRSLWQLDEIRMARRLKAFDLTFDGVKRRVMRNLRAMPLEKVDEGETDQQQVISIAGGDFSNYVEGAADNIITNYLGIPTRK